MLLRQDIEEKRLELVTQLKKAEDEVVRLQELVKAYSKILEEWVVAEPPRFLGKPPENAGSQMDSVRRILESIQNEFTWKDVQTAGIAIGITLSPTTIYGCLHRLANNKQPSIRVIKDKNGPQPATYEKLVFAKGE